MARHEMVGFPHSDIVRFTSWGRGVATALRLASLSRSTILREGADVIDSAGSAGSTGSLAGRRIGRYRIERKLGEGGMGTVWAAKDLRLLRDVALKVIREEKPSEDMRGRFFREARAAAAVNHPGICQVYEIDEDDGVLFIAMELLTGETLASRLQRGPLPRSGVLAITESMLRALGALHERGLVHRDLKPSNVFLLESGSVKLLDFGLVRAVVNEEETDASAPLTAAGSLIGTPAYMSPEQVEGNAVDARTDLFAAGAIVHEMVTGVPVFWRRSVGETLAAVLRDDPLPLSSDLTPLDDVLRRALRKSPQARPASASILANELRQAISQLREDSGGSETTKVIDSSKVPSQKGLPALSPVPAQPPARPRLAVIPFRLLRPDPDIDFLSFSLADAVAQSLTSISSIGVRSVLAAAPFSVPAPDLTALAQKLDVSLALFGTILKSGGRCRVSAQLLEVPSGQLLCAHTSEASADDVFSLQDALTRQIVQELHLPLDKGASRIDVPASADAYELFLRGNQAALWGRDLSVARGLYRACLELDPAFSPAWARLARCYHLESKYGSVVNRAENERLAEEALDRALALNPQLALAHRQRALLDVERGRAEEAVERLLEMVSKRPGDPEGWAGLVTALRFLGLLTESIAAHKRARALDPHVPTSAFHTYYSIGDFDSMLAATTNSPYEVALGLKLSGRMAEALAEIRKEVLPAQGLAREWSRALHADLVDDSDSMLDAVRRLQAFPDPEGRYYMSVLSSRFDKDLSVELLASAVDGGYVNVPAFHRDPALFRLRELPAFERALATAEKRHQAARARFANCVK